MPTGILLLPTIVSCLLLAAHMLRAGNVLFAAACLLLPIVLLPLRRRWVAITMQVILIVAAAEWMRTLFHIAAVRLDAGESWARAGIILATVAALNLFAASLFRTKRLRLRYPADHQLVCGQ